MSRLRDYARKRDFAATPEPAGDAKKKARRGQPRFVIQLHHARARHFDFRLQVGDTLRSWAVPKGPSLRVEDKRLAVEVEDHPLSYATFEGHIPAGQYGGGHVRIADEGTWDADGDPEAALAAGKLVFRLHGDRLEGEWTLVRTARQQGNKPQWLLIKHRDAFVADTDLDEMLGSPGPEVAPPAVRRAAKGTAGRARGTSLDWRELALALPGARRGEPDDAPMLAKSVPQAPDGDGWLHEIKWDGWRVLARRDGDTLRLKSRNGNDWSGRFPRLEAAFAALPGGDFIADGELVVLGDDGYSDFTGLQRALEAGDDRGLQVIVFDLLRLDGVDVTRAPLVGRKALLEAWLGTRPPRPLWYGAHLAGNGPRVAAKTFKRGFEGIVSKRADAPYRAGRGDDWRKVKREDGTDATIVGYTLPKGARSGIGALLLAMRDGKAWRYVGRVGSGLDTAMLADLRRTLDTLRRDEPVLALPDHVPLPRKAITWVEPQLVVEVAHRGWGKEGLLRQASFRRLRLDKSPVEEAVAKRGATAPRGNTRDRSAPQDRAATSTKTAARGPRRATPAQQPSRDATLSPARKKTSSKRATAPTTSVTLSSPDRIVDPSSGLTKQDVFDYYTAIAPWLLPGLAGRPLSVVRAPDGIDGELFFQKHAGAGMGDAIQPLPVRGKAGGRQDYLAIENTRGLLQLVQMNALEFHPWGATPGDPEHPDRIVFDLDPGDGVTWKAVLAAARAIRDRLADVGLPSFPLLSGGKGVHVVVPLAGRDGWDDTKAFARAVAQVFAAQEPRRYVATATKAKRDGRIFIDWLRNGRGATSVAPWSLRARPGLPVAVPVSWKELDTLRSPKAFDLHDALARAKSLRKHPWGDPKARRPSLPKG